jgi:uncharacterized RDD family membrane protein YckC
VVEHDLAGIGSRALAQAIDGLIIGVCEIFVVLADLFIGPWLAGWITLTFVIVFSAALPIAYFTLYEWKRGATPGKRALRIRVLTEHGTPIGLRESVTRNLLRIIDVLPGAYALGGIVALISKRNQRLGDMAAGTVAVRIARPPAGRPSPRASTFVEMAAPVAAADGLSYELLSIVEEFHRRRANLTAEARSQLARRLAERIERYVPRPAGIDDEEYIDGVFARRHELQGGQ